MLNYEYLAIALYFLIGLGVAGAMFFLMWGLWPLMFWVWIASLAEDR